MSGKIKLFLSLIALSVVGFTAGRSAFAELEDSDYDGLTNQSEVSTYKTDPNVFDSDGDGYSDSVEVLAGSDPNNSQSTPVTVLEKNKLSLLEQTDPLSWYISRISGIVAFVLLTFVVLMGLVQTSKSLIKYRVMSFMTAEQTHRALAWMGGISVFIHFSSLFFDKVFQLKVFEALIPFQVARSFKSAIGMDFKLTISLGIFAIYFIILLVATSELRKKVIPTKMWRLVHYISFFTYLLFLAHGIFSGTDTKTWWMMAIYISSFVLVFGMFLARIFKNYLFLPRRIVHEPANQGNSQVTQ